MSLQESFKRWRKVVPKDSFFELRNTLSKFQKGKLLIVIKYEPIEVEKDEIPGIAKHILKSLVYVEWPDMKISQLLLCIVGLGVWNSTGIQSWAHFYMCLVKILNCTIFSTQSWDFITDSNIACTPLEFINVK